MLVGANAGETAAPTPGRATPVRPPSVPQQVATGIQNAGDTFVQAIHNVFAAQPPHVQQRIVQAARANPSHPAAQAFFGRASALLPPKPPGGQRPGPGLSLGQALGDIVGFLGSQLPGTGGIGDVRTLGGAVTPSGILSASAKAIKGVGEAAAGLHGLGQKVPGGNQLASIGTGPVANSFVQNVASDAANIAGAPLTTLALTAKDITHPRSLLNDFIAFPKQLVEHPVQTFEQHPLLSALVAQGGLAGVSRLGAAPLRAFAPEGSAVGRALSTNREGVWLTGKLTHERPPYSKSPYVKSQQRAAENAYLIRGPGGQLIPARGGLGDQLRNRWINQGVGELAQMRERVRRVGQNEVVSSHQKWFSPGAAGKAAHAAKTSLAYNPDPASVVGGVVAHLIADGTVHTPETYAADLAAYRDLIARNRPNLVADVEAKLPNAQKALDVHDANVRLLTHEINAGRTPKQLAPVFAAIAKDREAYLPLEPKALAFGHYGAEMTKQGLLRRTLQPYAMTHLGARVDPEQGLMTDHPLTTPEILQQLLKDTKGRMPTYVAQHVHPDLRDNPNAKRYVPGERLPTPDTKSNTGYAYSHGLINLGHTALLERRSYLQNVLDSHATQALLVDQLANQLPKGGYASTFADAKRAAPPGMRPFNLAHPFHHQAAFEQHLEAGGVDPLAVEEEAIRRGWDLGWRTKDTGGAGKWGMIDEQALKALDQQANNISPDVLSRSFRSLNTQFRTVALSTSPKHVPGVMFENLIRFIANGVGFRSWLTGHRAIGRAPEVLGPEGAKQFATWMRGGQAAGMTEANRVFRVSDHWSGTSIHPFLKAMEGTFKLPVARQARLAWRAWTKVAIGGTKKLIEEQAQTAYMGKGLLQDHGYAEAARLNGFVGMFQRALGLHGQMLDDALRGYVDPAKARQMRTLINRMGGKWMDLSPHGQRALMFSPFGLWWVNSARFLARMPIDMPVKTGMLASLTAAKQQQRQQLNMNFLSPGALPGYEMGGIPSGGKIIAQNYYSPFGMVNDPAATAVSLFEPWLLQPANAAAFGINWLGKPLTAPGQNTSRGNEKSPSGAQRAQYVIDSVLSSFLPLYLKAAQVAEGGSSAYDVNPNTGIVPPLLEGKAPLTKTPGKGFAAGLATATRPFRQYTPHPPKSSAGSWGFAAGGSSSSAGSGGGGGWGFSGGGSGSGGSSGGWGFK